MEFSKLIAERFSVRSFAPTEVAQEHIDAILEAARIAPTACNYMPQKIVVVRGDEAIAKLDECSPCRYGAPLAFVICYDREICWQPIPGEDRGSGKIDASIVGTHMMLQAAALGLGSIWVGMFDPKKIREKFGIPAHVVPIAVLPVGYPAADCAPHEYHTTNRALDEILI